MKKLDYKRPFFRKTHAKKFLGILACSQTVYFFFRIGAPNPIFLTPGFLPASQWVPGLAPTYSLPLQWGPNTLDTALKSGTEPIRCGAFNYYFSRSVRRSFCLYDSWPRPVIFKTREYSAATKL